MGLVIGSRLIFGPVTRSAGGRVPLGEAGGTAGGRKEPVGLAGPGGGPGTLAVESSDGAVDFAGAVVAGGAVDLTGA
jgi:hypothetical protein